MNIFDPFGANANLASIARRHLWAAPVVALLGMSIGLLEGVGVSFLIPFVSTLTDSSAVTGQGIFALVARFGYAHGRNERLLIIASVILGCALLKSALQVLANTFAASIDGRAGHQIRCELSKRLQSVSFAFFQVQQPARLVNILNTESWKASEAVRVILTRIASLAAVVVFGILLLLASWPLSLMVFAGGLAARYIQKRMETRIRECSMRSVSASQTLSDRILFIIFGSRVIRLFNQQQSEQIRFESASDEVRRAALKVESLSGALWPSLEAIHVFLFLIVLLIAVFAGISLPVLAAFLVLMNRLQPHLRSFEQSGAAFASVAGRLDEVEWLLSGADKPMQQTGDLAFRGLREGIEFDNVSFAYPDQRGEPALVDASFVLRRGRATALIGASGAGKSTVINLLCRLVEPVSGDIRVDGVPLSRINLCEWLSDIGVAGQDIDLIDGTIAENISYGRTGIDRVGIERAARSAQADFIDSLPERLECRVGPRGLNLSGGQRQRIGIARALARQPAILILDEATNAVDHETEVDIIRTFQELKKSMTVIVVSHRPATIAFCDDAVVFNCGRVVETGPLPAVLNYRSMQAERPDSSIAASTLIEGGQTPANPRLLEVVAAS
jgi:subfamily B ATP-binding cassette protein MsbA